MTDEGPEHRTPTAWLPVARNIEDYACLDAAGEIVCRHRLSSAMLRHKKHLTTGAVLKDGALIQVHMRELGASNGERVVLPYANRPEDYAAVLACDKAHTTKALTGSLQTAQAERERLWDRFQGQGGRGVELADEIDRLDAEIGVLKRKIRKAGGKSRRRA